MREPEFQTSLFAAGRAAGHSFPRPWAHALVSEVFGRFVDRLRDAIHASVSGTNNLFDFSAHVSVSEIADFRAQREQWLEQYETNLRLLFERRIAGDRRRGGRPDAQASLATVQLLDPFDQEIQVALIKTVNDLHAVTAPELAALNPRIALLLNEDRGDVFDNPFGPPYVLDAIGSAARSVYRTSHVWRALMDRVVADITPVFLKMYIAENRFLADQNVLPDIKARLRVQSPHFPSDERDLFQTFSRLLTGAAPVPSVPSVPTAFLHVVGHPPPALRTTFTGGGPARPANSSRTQIPFGMSQTVPMRLPDQEIRFALSKLARLDAESGAAVAESAGPRFAPAPRPVAPNPFASEAPAAQRASKTLIDMLDRLQAMDLPSAIVRAAPPIGGRKHDVALVPSNLVPYIRAVVVDQIASSNHSATMDLVGLVFDHIFRDPSIPDTLHPVFERLQVPILKAAIIDPALFSTREHPARRLLDRLAESSIGATTDPDYFHAFEAAALDVVEHVRMEMRLDVSVFDAADARLRNFIEDDQRHTAIALSSDVMDAMAAEQGEPGRSQARALVRDRLMGLDVPFFIRSFAETVWTEYLSRLEPQIAGNRRYTAALQTLDNLLWSVSPKNRHAHRTRLCRLIPSLIVGLRRGCREVNLPAEQFTAFFDELYEMHTSLIGGGASARSASRNAPLAAHRAPTSSLTDIGAGAAMRYSEICDFVGEMIVGSWIEFADDGHAVVARLWWVSPMRSRYIFVGRSRARGWIFTPQELAQQMRAGRARVVIEPVPLFDRAVNAALDTVAGADSAAIAA